MTDRAPYLDSEGEGTAGVVVVAPVSKQLRTRFETMSVSGASSAGEIKRCLQRGALCATRVWGGANMALASVSVTEALPAIRCC